MLKYFLQSAPAAAGQAGYDTDCVMVDVIHMTASVHFGAFDKVWQAALWPTIKKYISASASLIRVIKHIYDKVTDAFLYNGSIGDWFRTTVGVRQGCLHSPTLFNIFLERILTDALQDHEGTVSTGGRTITNIRFADDIDGSAGEKEELAK